MKRLMIIWALTLPVFAIAQEYLTGVAENRVIQQYLKGYGNISPDYKTGFIEYKALNLPFFDDFSKITIYPDTCRWLDRYAYINATFPYFPVNYGVATLDVLDASGSVYPNATIFTFEADRLTSKPIRLDSVFDPAISAIRSLTPADSVYFSFFYQPQGRGDQPLAHDSLVLEFGFYNDDTVFSHFDSVWVYGYEYLNTADEFLPSQSYILSPFGCDSLWYQLTDTLFYNDSVRIPCDSIFTLGIDWEFIWSAAGESLDSFLVHNGSFFKYAMFPITNPDYFQPDFQFRFKNYGSISAINSWQSNTDQWHIDQVYLNWNRRALDRFSPEITFVQDAPSFIEDYTSMPYQHYSGNITGLKRDSIELYINNLDSIAHPVKYDYFVQNYLSDTLPAFAFDALTVPLNPYFLTGPEDYQPAAWPEVTYFFTSLSEDTADFRISHVIRNMDFPDQGDTLIYNQEFRNYFSYDDGSAEAGYGLSPSGAKLAVRFRTEVVDTLRGVKMFFNRTFANNNNRPFRITVWNDNDGIPGNVLYDSANIRPVFTEGFNQFHTYVFMEPVKMGIGAFYIGWTQTTNDNLNIGFDRNTNSRSKNFYNVDGTWVNSSFEGSIMIRPVLGKALLESNPGSKSVDVGQIVIRPNPPAGASEVTIDLPAAWNDPDIKNRLDMKLIDLVGRIVWKGSYVPKINVSNLHPGIHILLVSDPDTGLRYSTKLLIVQ